MSGLGRNRTSDAEGRFRLNIPDGLAGELIVYSDRWAPRRVEVPAGGGDLGDVRLEAGVEFVGRLRDPRIESFIGEGRAAGLTAKAFVPGGRPLANQVIASKVPMAVRSAGSRSPWRARPTGKAASASRAQGLVQGLGGPVR